MGDEAYGLSGEVRRSLSRNSQQESTRRFNDSLKAKATKFFTSDDTSRMDTEKSHSRDRADSRSQASRLRSVKAQYSTTRIIDLLRSQLGHT